MEHHRTREWGCCQVVLHERDNALWSNRYSSRSEEKMAISPPESSCGVCEVVWGSATKALSERFSLGVIAYFSKKLDSPCHLKCYQTPQKCPNTKQLRKLTQSRETAHASPARLQVLLGRLLHNGWDRSDACHSQATVGPLAEHAPNAGRAVLCLGCVNHQ